MSQGEWLPLVHLVLRMYKANTPEMLLSKLPRQDFEICLVRRRALCSCVTIWKLQGSRLGYNGNSPSMYKSRSDIDIFSEEVISVLVRGHHASQKRFAEEVKCIFSPFPVSCVGRVSVEGSCFNPGCTPWMMGGHTQESNCVRDMTPCALVVKVLKLAVSYHECNWTPEYDLPPSKVWTLQLGLKHEPSTDTLHTLRNRIIDAEIKWGKDTDFEGEFTYVPGYWEWAEYALNFFSKPLTDVMLYDAVYAPLFTYDCNINVVQAFCEAWCTRTNTLITSFGEMSISLRDLYMLGGLPLSGDIYDKHIPNALDLAKGSHKCCVWKTQKYEAPPPRKENKKSWPKATHNPSGILEASRWPHFVLPREPTATICLETFKMACKIAKGNKVCLALSIYYGLNSISESTSPGQMGTPFPIHYVYGWLSSYFQIHFKTHCLVSSYPKMVISSREGDANHYDKMDACKRIFKGECVSWLCTNCKNDRLHFFMTTREGAKRTLNTSYVCALVFLFYTKDPSVKNPFMSKYMIFIASLLNDICEKLRETLVESVSSFKGSVAKQLHFMKRDGVDLSSLENRVDRLFKKAEDYDKIWSQLSEAMPVEAQVMELCLAQGVLKDAQQKLSKTQTLLSEQQKILEDCDGQVTLIE
nr:ABC transporter G family member 11 [Ipomoea batatas]